jgi:hypothetical protein
VVIVGMIVSAIVRRPGSARELPQATDPLG